MVAGRRLATPGAAASGASSAGTGAFTTLRALPEVFQYTRHALELVWATSRRLSIALAILTVVAGMVPAAIAYVGALIVDAVVAAIATHGASGVVDLSTVLSYVGFEGLLVAALAATQRGLSTSQSLLRAQLGQRVNEMILEKALTLELRHFEDSEFYDKLTRARREASTRPLSLVMRSFGLVQNGIALASYGILLSQFSAWAVLVLLLAGLPAFVAEAKFSGDAFRLFRWRSPETRMQMYLETVLAREDHAKEVKLFGLGSLLLDRYRAIFRKVFKEDRALTIRRDTWGFFLGLISTAAFYAAYAWIAVSAVRGQITLGQMTMYVLLFRQGQSAVSASLASIGGMYEDNLYLSTLYDYLDTPVDTPSGAETAGPDPTAGVRFEAVSFTYPGASEPAVDGVSFHLRPGQSLALVGENGSGKTTLIKLLTRLYVPSAGRITLDGLDLADWNPTALRRRVAVIFQDFARYQLKVGENIGVGDVAHFEDEARWRAAAELATAAPFVGELPEGYQTQLGKWFKDGRELSGGQWQKIALARAFIREGADILVLDEPTAAMDARAEAQVFEQFRELARERMVILISHRFSTVRMADQILVIQGGRILERGDHEALMRLDGHYAHLFSLQARGYR
ncbi:MAG: ABC transporter ATP-binding protein/permease [Steroidobacteraceae bacterium]|nr:ABC transporter ATP-binding protein/permease [Steroidobacteraceae bacterium]